MIMLCYLPINTCFNFIFKTSFEKSMPEFTVSLLCVILGTTHSISYTQALIISLSSSISYYTFIPVLFAIRKRLEYADPVQEFKSGSLIFISIAVIMLCLYSFHISWLPLGGF
jgi:Na+-translocating ferredoxin:NAD+ oxidoreductase RnfA subunit